MRARWLSLAVFALACSNGSDPIATPSDADAGSDLGAAIDTAIDTAVVVDTTPAVDDGPPTSDAKKPPLLSDDFESFGVAMAWADGTTHGAWRAISNGYGETTIALDGSKTLEQKPRASTKLDETHANMVVSNVVVAVDFDLTLRMKTVAQLRTPTPNAWEVAWIGWHHTDEGHFYYFVPKPNGFELAKVDTSKKDPSGPACVWPEYANCKYPGGQRYLVTGSKPAFPVGVWYRLAVRQVGNTMSVKVDDVDVASFTDTEAPYASGSIALYNEDAHVRFDDVRVVAR